MSRNMRSKLTATDRTYVHSYWRFLSFDMFLNPQIHLKSMLTVLARQQGRSRGWSRGA